MKEFIILNRLLVLTTLKFLIIIFLFVPLTIYSILLLTGNINTPVGSLIEIIGYCLGLLTFITAIMFFKGTYDLKVTRRNFNSNPFNELEKIGFQKILLNQNSKSNFVKEVHRGEINGFIIDADTETHSESQYLRFRFSLKPLEELEESEIDFKTFNYPNIVSGFSEILLKYHFKNNELKTIQQLEKELTEMTLTLNKKRFE